jgi:L-seryl-tRNA(Ser) seleniumtransferase
MAKTGQPGAAAKVAAREELNALMRQLPSVDELLKRPRLEALVQQAGRALVVDVARASLEQVRAGMQRGDGGNQERGALETLVEQGVARTLAGSLRGVINATGVILHTNLGRAPLSEAAIQRVREAATQYSNLEYDLAAGARGKRDVHTAGLIARLTGADAAIVVNNNAAALLLALNALAKGGEVVVSRGELVEIGDGFRIPDVMAESGAVLREVGTTNRTTIADYERALGERTRLLLRVHRSNFRIEGFTAQPALEELVELGQRRGLPVLEDLGSGCLVDLSAQGVDEPVARASLEAGVPLVCFSGDKLLGGPQAGIIAGQRELVARIRRNPLFRALRVDKLTIAALEATLLAYARGAHDEIPALRMIRMPVEEIAQRAAAFSEQLRAALPAGSAEVELRDGQSVIGGGSTPAQHLPTKLLAIRSARLSAAQLDTRLRQPASGVPVIARVEDDGLVLDLRTVFPEQEAALVLAFNQVLAVDGQRFDIDNILG